MKLLAIGGSPRLEGNTNYLIDQALEEASKLGAEVSKIVLSQHNLNPCLGHDDCHGSPETETIRHHSCVEVLSIFPKS